MRPNNFYLSAPYNPVKVDTFEDYMQKIIRNEFNIIFEYFDMVLSIKGSYRSYVI